MAYEKDVASIDAIVKATYDVISGPAGPKDWDRERFLMHPEARMVRGRPPGDRGGSAPTPGLDIFDVERFIAFARPKLTAEDFYEDETGREVFRFGRMAHVISAYASATSRDKEPYARGVNLIQLWFDAGRWWVMSVVWDWAGEGDPIPERLVRSSLPDKGPR